MTGKLFRLLIPVAILACLSGCRHATAPPPSPAAATPEAKTVTGTNIRTREPVEKQQKESVSPLRVVTKEELDQTGEPTLGRALKKKIPNYR